MTISIWRYSHLLLAVMSSVFIIIASLTGAILSFEPIVEKSNAYKIDGIEELSLAQTVSALNNSYAEIIELNIDYNQFVFATVVTKKGDFLSGYINPLTAEYLGPKIEKKQFFKFATNLHRSLFLKSTGRFFIGLASFLLVLITLTGFLLIVRRQGSLKSVFSKIVYENFFQYFHVVLGRLSFVSILIIAITGVYLSLLRFSVLPENDEISHFVEFKNIKMSDEKAPSDFDVFRNTKLIEVNSLNFPFSKDIEDNYTLRLKDKELLISQFTGHVLSAKNIGLTDGIKETSINLHTGKGSYLWSIILAISSINILFFVYSGFAMTLKRNKSKMQNKYKAKACKYVILVGSENGNTIRYANAFYKALIENGEQVYMSELNEYTCYKKCEYLAIFTSTYGQGEAPVNANKFLELLKTVKQKNTIKYAVVGFGSTNYPDFCKFAINITKTLKSIDAKPFIKPAYINNRSFDVFLNWCKLWSDNTGILINISEKDVD